MTLLAAVRTRIWRFFIGVLYLSEQATTGAGKEIEILDISDLKQGQYLNRQTMSQIKYISAY